MNANLFARLAARFPADRAAVFLRTPGGPDLKFGALCEGAGRLAALLRELGVAPGARVAVQVEKSPEAVCLYLACLQAGAVYVPLNPAYTPAELHHFIEDAEPRVLVCDPRSASALGPAAASVGARLLTLGAQGEGDVPARAAELQAMGDVAMRAEDDTAAILYTSGTTGRAKGAMLSHGNLWSNARSLHRLWGLQAEDVLIHALPLYHTHGLFVALNLMLMTGGQVIVLPRFDAEEVTHLLPRATVLMGVPTFYTRLLASPRLTRAACANMRLFVSGSSPLLASTYAAFEERTGHRVLERYGMTETGMNASNPLEGERRAGSVGPALPGVALRVVDTQGRVVTPGKTGGLEVKGPNVFAGYWRNPEKTAEAFREDGWFRTGDLATLGADGYVTIVGRDKDLIISGGLNIYPREVEAALDALPEVIESAVIGAPHPDLGEGVIAVLAVSGDPGDVVGCLRKSLAPYKLPRHVVQVDALPRNAMGKVQKAELRTRFQTVFTGTQATGGRD